jgi:DNA (cytosine-5)-methyltransferase 1
LEQIRASGGRTTYYGRLRWDKPSYTVTTYFNRPGNGCYIHPSDGTDNLTQQNRLISFREAARLQSFPDSFIFLGSKTSQYNQIGNAVPPLLAYSIAKQIKGATALDLFCGCGGMSHGFELAGFDVLLGVDIEKHAMKTWAHNHKGKPILGDITKSEVKDQIFDTLAGRAVDIIIGGPPCQGFSTAGWRQDTDPRNQLWNDYLVIVERVNPNYFIIENVPGILTAKQNGSTVLENMKLAFGKLGYLLKVKKLKAEEYGIPQLRRRVIIVGHKESVEFQFPEPITSIPITVKDAIYNLPMLGVSDGIEMLELSNYKPTSLYESWLIGKVNTSEYFDQLKYEHLV